MKKLMIATACIFALSTGGALAQMQPAPGASSEGNVGPGATSSSKHVKKGMKTGLSKGTTTGMGTGTTTGMGTGTARSHKSMSANPSSSGNVGPGTNNNNGPQPGGR